MRQTGAETEGVHLVALPTVACRAREDASHSHRHILATKSYASTCYKGVIQSGGLRDDDPAGGQDPVLEGRDAWPERLPSLKPAA